MAEGLLFEMLSYGEDRYEGMVLASFEAFLEYMAGMRNVTGFSEYRSQKHTRCTTHTVHFLSVHC